MTPKEIRSSLEKKSEFVNWKKSHAHAFLAHFFTTCDTILDPWQLGYFDPDSNKITTFVIDQELVTMLPESDYLKSEPIKELKIDTNLITAEKALASAEEAMKKEYRAEHVLKRFLILQMINAVPTYNITCFTRTFKTVNFKIDANSGNLYQHSSTPLADFGGSQ